MHHEATTGPDGRFVFDRVVAGRGGISRDFMLTTEGATDVMSSGYVPANFPAGQTVTLDLGGNGRPVLGTLRPPQGSSDKVHWEFAIVTLMSGGPEARPDRPSFKATVGPDGAFRIDDVPAGRYSLCVRFQREGVGRLRDFPLDVPRAHGNLAEQPLDLGKVTLEEP
jgi:hypothetical protein